MRINRTQFLTLGAVAASSALLGCGSDDGESSADGDCSTGASGDIVSNHGHQLTVPAADIEAGEAKAYSIQGTSPHDHMVSISAAQMAQLAAGETLSLTSSTDGGHAHAVTVTC